MQKKKKKGFWAKGWITHVQSQLDLHTNRCLELLIKWVLQKQILFTYVPSKKKRL